MLKQIKETVDFLAPKINQKPEVGIVLGSGLGGLVNEIEIEHEFHYSDIPHFPVSTVEGHSGKLIFGKLAGKNVVTMQGRFHYYEGYTLQQVTYPIRIMQQLGIKNLTLSNASGGVNPTYQIGDLMILDDHINLLPANPLTGLNLNDFGPRFPDMSEPYDKKLIDIASQVAKKNSFRCHVGVYAAVSGPCFETRAEYKYIRTIGADTVGMSTVPEVIVARHMSIPCFAMSIITDLGGMEEVQTVSHEEVLQVANEAEGRMTTIFKEVISKM